MANKRIIHYAIVWNWWLAHWADRSAEGYRQDSISAYDYGRQLMYENLERSAREKAQKRQNTADVLTLLLLLQPRVTAQPAKSAGARLVVRESAMASVGRKKAAKSITTGKAAFLVTPDDFSAKFRQIEIEGNLTLVPVGSSIANAIDKQAVKLPTAPIVVDVKADPHEAAANQRRAEFRQRRLWAEYDSGTLEAIDFCPELPPAPEVPKAQRQHVYDGRYYGSYSYYSRNR